MATQQLTSREVMGVLKATTPSFDGWAMVADYITRLHAALDEADQSDVLGGTEGWRRYLLGEDE